MFKCSKIWLLIGMLMVVNVIVAQNEFKIPQEILDKLPENGSFNLKHEVHQEGSGNKSYFYALSGSMYNESPDGKWQFLQQQFIATSLKVSKNKLSADITGKETAIQYNFSRGVLTGAASIRQDSLVNGRVVKRLQNMQVQFKDGLLHGKFEALFEDLKITGKFSSQFFDGEWLWMSGKDSLAKAIYREGILVAYHSKTFNYVHKELQEAIAQNIKYERSAGKGLYFNGFKSPEQYDLHVAHTKQLAFTLQAVLLPLTSILPLSVDHVFETFFTRSMLYKRSNEEQNRLHELEHKVAAIIDVTDSLLHDPILRLSQFHDKALADFYALLQITDFEMKRWMDFIQQSSREEARMMRLDDFSDANANILAVYQAYKSGVKNSETTILLESKGLLMFEMIIDEWQNDIENGLRTLEQNRITIRNKAALATQENEMLDYIEQFKGRTNTDFLLDSVSLKHRILKLWTDSVLDNLILKYAALADVEERKAEARQILIYCKTVHENPFLATLDSLPKRINRAYNYFVNNPFTGAYDIPVRKKSRFHQIAMSEAFEYGILQLAYSSELKEWESNQEKIALFYAQMMKIASQSEFRTRKIERRVRSEKDAGKIYRWIKNY